MPDVVSGLDLCDFKFTLNSKSLLSCQLED
jgi:hypothetical protein